MASCSKLKILSQAVVATVLTTAGRHTESGHGHRLLATRCTRYVNHGRSLSDPHKGREEAQGRLLDVTSTCEKASCRGSIRPVGPHSLVTLQFQLSCGKPATSLLAKTFI